MNLPTGNRLARWWIERRCWRGGGHYWDHRCHCTACGKNGSNRR